MAVTDFSFATCTVTLAALVAFGFFSFSLYVLYQHWRHRHIPGPARDGFFSGNVPFIRREMQRNPAGMPLISYNWYHEYGSVYVLWIYHIPIVILSDPDAAKKALVTLNLPKAHRMYSLLSYMFGQRALGRSILTEIDHEVWSRKRNMLNPAFHRKYLMNLMDAFNSVGDEFLEKLNQLADGNTPVKMTDEFARVTLDIIGKVGKVFGAPNRTSTKKVLDGKRKVIRRLITRPRRLNSLLRLRRLISRLITRQWRLISRLITCLSASYKSTYNLSIGEL